MKKFGLLFISILVISFAACSSNDKKQVSYTDEGLLIPASMSYSSEDSATILSLVDNYINSFEQRDFSSCADMIYRLDHGVVVPLSDAEKRAYITAMSHIPNIYAVRMSHIFLRSDKNNEVRLAYKIMPDGDFETGRGTSSISLNPIYNDSTWYLTLLDKNAEGVEDIYKNEN